jgi:hypothetical protein
VRRSFSIYLAAAAISGCGEASPPAPNDPLDAPAQCSSQELRSPNASESAEMAPGRACNACHESSNIVTGEGDAPIFAFAGTVYPTGHEPNDCVGSAAEGAEVEVTDADGNVFSQLANRSGNFAGEPSKFKAPYTALVRFQGRERKMLVPQAIGDCNSCHTETGASAAPGRITLP